MPLHLLTYCLSDIYLYAKNTKDDEKCRSYKHNVSNWFQWGYQSLHDNFQTGRSTDDPEIKIKQFFLTIVFSEQVYPPHLHSILSLSRQTFDPTRFKTFRLGTSGLKLSEGVFKSPETG